MTNKKLSLHLRSHYRSIHRLTWKSAILIVLASGCDSAAPHKIVRPKITTNSSAAGELTASDTVNTEVSTSPQQPVPPPTAKIDPVDPKVQTAAIRIIEQQQGFVETRQDADGIVAVGAYLTQRKEISPELLSAILDLRDLRRLSLPRCSVSEDHLAKLTDLSTIESLDLRGAGITDRGLSHLPRLTQLRELRLGEDESPITNKGLEYLARLSQLETLDLSGAQIDDQGLRFIGNLTRLVELNLSECPLKGVGLANLHRLSRLRRLDVSRSFVPFEDQGPWRIPSLPQLELLDAGEISVDESFFAAVSRLPKLSRLRLEGTVGVTDTALRHLENLPLIELRLDGADLTDRAIDSIAKIGSLQLLSLRYNQLTAGGIRRLAKLPLRAIWLGGNDVQDEGAAALAQIPSLQTLELFGASLTNEAAGHIAKLSKLRMLDIRDNPSMDNTGLGHLSAAGSLEYLNVGGAAVNDQGLRPLASLNHLKGLDLQGTDVTDEAEKLLSNLPSLVDLNLDDTLMSTEAKQRLQTVLQNRRTSNSAWPRRPQATKLP